MFISAAYKLLFTTAELLSALPVTELAEPGALPRYVCTIVLGCLQALQYDTWKAGALPGYMCKFVLGCLQALQYDTWERSGYIARLCVYICVGVLAGTTVRHVESGCIARLCVYICVGMLAGTTVRHVPRGDHSVHHVDMATLRGSGLVAVCPRRHFSRQNLGEHCVSLK